MSNTPSRGGRSGRGRGEGRQPSTNRSSDFRGSQTAIHVGSAEYGDAMGNLVSILLNLDQPSQREAISSLRRMVDLPPLPSLNEIEGGHGTVSGARNTSQPHDGRGLSQPTIGRDFVPPPAPQSSKTPKAVGLGTLRVKAPVISVWDQTGPLAETDLAAELRDMSRVDRALPVNQRKMSTLAASNAALSRALKTNGGLFHQGHLDAVLRLLSTYDNDTLPKVKSLWPNEAILSASATALQASSSSNSGGSATSVHGQEINRKRSHVDIEDGADHQGQNEVVTDSQQNVGVSPDESLNPPLPSAEGLNSPLNVPSKNTRSRSGSGDKKM
jgi:hypothetical protein